MRKSRFRKYKKVSNRIKLKVYMLLSVLLIVGFIGFTIVDSFLLNVNEHQVAKQTEDITKSNATDKETNDNSHNTEKENTEDSLIVDKTWEPVGTIQQEPHVTKYEQGSIDWEEMTKAFSTAIGVSPDDITLWWVGNDGAEDKSFAIVSQRRVKDYKRVSIEWVKNKGWKPTSVRDLTDDEYKKYIKK